MRIDLTDTTFIIPIKLDSVERARNLLVTLGYLTHHFETTILIKELDTSSKIYSMVVRPANTASIDLSKVQFSFEQNTRMDGLFHRTKVLNDMLLSARTPIVVNYDADILLPVSSYVQAATALRQSTQDVVYPFNRRQFNIQRDVFIDYRKDITLDMTDDESDLRRILLSGYDIKEFERLSTTKVGMRGEALRSGNGYCQFFNRRCYIDGFMENEDFISYGPEDDERYYRFSTLYRVGHVTDFVYHMDHPRGPDSSDKHKFALNNRVLKQHICSMDREALLEYYSSKQYVKHRRTQLQDEGDLV